MVPDVCCGPAVRRCLLCGRKGRTMANKIEQWRIAAYQALATIEAQPTEADARSVLNAIDHLQEVIEKSAALLDFVDALAVELRGVKVLYNHATDRLRTKCERLLVVSKQRGA